MEPKSLLPFSQGPATSHYPKPDASTAHITALFI
jgi:hypothetical protein